MSDKDKHLLASAAITIIVLILFTVIPHREMYGWDKAIALFVGIFAGAFKEFIWDKALGKGKFEWRDLESSVYGSFAAMFGWAIIEAIILTIKYWLI